MAQSSISSSTTSPIPCLPPVPIARSEAWSLSSGIYLRLTQGPLGFRSRTEPTEGMALPSRVVPCPRGVCVRRRRHRHVCVCVCVHVSVPPWQRRTDSHAVHFAVLSERTDGPFFQATQKRTWVPGSNEDM